MAYEQAPDQPDALCAGSDISAAFRDFVLCWRNTGGAQSKQPLQTLSLRTKKSVGSGDLTGTLPDLVRMAGILRLPHAKGDQNAVEAMDSVGKDRRVLRVRTEHKGDAISVEIEDTGPGIDPKKLDNIFDAFFTTKPHGMGLGLAICRMIVEGHKGQLAASSANPHGAIFRIMLPQVKSLQ